MRIGQLVGRAAAGLALMAGFTALPALAQDKPQDQKPMTLLIAEHAGLEALAADPKDAGLKRALSMLPDRLLELTEEVGAPHEAMEAITLMLRTVARPAKIAVTYTPGEPTGGMFGYGLALSIDTPGQDVAKRDHEIIVGMLREAHAPIKASEDNPGLFELEAGPLGTLVFGPRQSGSGWKYQAILGTLNGIDNAFKAMPESQIKGGTSLIHGRLDLAALTPIKNMIVSGGGAMIPGFAVITTRLERMGLIGPDALKIRFDSGHSASAMVSLVRIENAAKYKDALHLSTQPLSAAELRAIPADASHASLSRGDFSAFSEIIGELEKNFPEVGQGLAQFKKMTGVDPRADVLDTLGGAMGYYTADSTGGGGLGSLVFLMSFKDREKFMAAHNKLAAFANGMLSNEDMLHEGAKYIRLTAWKDGGTDLTSLRFNGIPVPFEITWAATDKWMIMGLTPQAVMTAARQANGKGDGGILTNPAVAETVGNKSGKLIALSFGDTARSLKDGYTFLSMLGSGIANGVRSPGEGKRDAGMIVPPYNELAKGVKSSVGFTTWDGNDLLMESYGDKSILVNVGSMAGNLTTILPVVAAAAVPAFLMERQMMAPARMMGDAGPARLDLQKPLRFAADSSVKLLSAFEPWFQPGPARALALLDQAQSLHRPALLDVLMHELVKP